MRRATLSLLALTLTLTVAGCGAASDGALRVSLAALQPRVAVPPPPGKSTRECGGSNLTASLRPPATMPAPGAMPAGSYMAAIQRRGVLVAGVDQNTLLLSYFNPLDDQFQGFEIDLLHELARAIFGDQNRIAFKVLTTDERFSATEHGSLDVVADAATITPERKCKVDFSSVYLDASQRVLVLKNSRAHSIHDLAGKRVCATTGSTSLDNITASRPKVIPVQVGQRTDCLVALQEGKVDAISSDDAILFGFAAQDPNVTLVGPGFSPQPYGMVINKAHPDFVRFVNGVLARMRSDGTWRRIYHRWFGRFASTPAPPPLDYLP